MTEIKVQTDSPVILQKDDAFQRYGYAKRIAETIAGHKETDSLVIGIYAKWGEGKTSMLNFLRGELKEQNIEAVDFNPWTYSTEEQMLVAFFRTLAKGLNLETQDGRESIANVLSKYASEIGVLGNLGGIGGVDKAAEKAADRFTAAVTKELRKKVDDHLTKANEKVVVFIDDIDRLTTQEVQDLFRLIKLIADFNNTIYVLAFDDCLVAKSLDEPYNGFGMDFLEKIVQLPLRLPKAQPYSIKKYVIDELNKAIRNLDVELSEVDANDFAETFTDHLLWQISSPRFAVRFVNSVSFAIPLLKGEVSVIDLLAIEAIKVLNPDLYNFIGEHPEAFTRNYDDPNYKTSSPGHTESKNLIEGFLKGFGELEKEKVLRLLLKLFPQLNHLFGRGHVHHGGWRKRYEQKRISSGSYIDRYFSYVVPEGQMADLVFSQLLESITSRDYLEQQDELIELLKDIDVGNFLFKLHRLEESFSAEFMAQLGRNLCLLGGRFPSETNTMFHLGDYYWLLARFIQDCVVMQEDEKASADLTKEIFERSQPLDFAFEIRGSLMSRLKNDPYPLKIGGKQIARASANLYSRARDGHSLFDLLSILKEANFRDLLLIGSDQNKRDIMREVRELIESDEKMFIRILYTFCSTIRSTSHPEPYKAGFDQSWYDWLAKVVSVDYFYKKSITLYGKQKDIGANDDRDPMTDKQLVGAFQKVYRENHSAKKKARVKSRGNPR